jgi:hypothetical protein
MLSASPSVTDAQSRWPRRAAGSQHSGPPLDMRTKSAGRRRRVTSLALRLAMLMMRRLFEKSAYARLEEVAIWARLNVLPPQSNLGDSEWVCRDGALLSMEESHRAFPF